MCKKEKPVTLTPLSYVENDGVKIPVYDFEAIKPLLSMNDDKVRVLNFWATWCKPCVSELPYFELLNSRYKSKNVEVILVSLDLPTQVKSKLIPFINRQKIMNDVVLLDDPDSNKWISKVDKSWSGSIPATIIYNRKKVKFFERSFTYNELEKEIRDFL